MNLSFSSVWWETTLFHSLHFLSGPLGGWVTLLQGLIGSNTRLIFYHVIFFPTYQSTMRLFSRS